MFSHRMVPRPRKIREAVNLAVKGIQRSRNLRIRSTVLYPNLLKLTMRCVFVLHHFMFLIIIVFFQKLFEIYHNSELESFL